MHLLVAPVACPLHVAPRVEHPEEVDGAPGGGHLTHQGDGVGVARDQPATPIMFIVLEEAGV